MRARDKAGGSAPDIQADFTQMAQLVTAIRNLADELSRNGTLSSHMDDPDLADALGRVERNWHTQRATLQTYLDSAADSVMASLTAYRQLESELAKAVATGAD
jgi:methionine synthase II (cobalamin-independent)